MAPFLEGKSIGSDQQKQKSIKESSWFGEPRCKLAWSKAWSNSRIQFAPNFPKPPSHLKWAFHHKTSFDEFVGHSWPSPIVGRAIVTNCNHKILRLIKFHKSFSPSGGGRGVVVICFVFLYRPIASNNELLSSGSSTSPSTSKFGRFVLWVVIAKAIHKHLQFRPLMGPLEGWSLNL